MKKSIITGKYEKSRRMTPPFLLYDFDMKSLFMSSKGVNMGVRNIS